MIMIVGGKKASPGWPASNDVYIYNIETNTYITNKPKLPEKRYSPTIVVKDDFIYSFGGGDKDKKPTKNVYRIKIDFQSPWEELDAELPSAVTAPMVVAYN